MIEISADGSKTLYSQKYQQTYHSLKDGAIKETLKKHILPAFKLSKEKSEIKILDICFGLGYNSLLTLKYTNSTNQKTDIYSPENDEELLSSLNSFDYPELLSKESKHIPELIENRYVEIGEGKINLYIGDAREYIKNFRNFFDIVYQDAFSPKKNSSLWSYEYFKDIKLAMKSDGILTTYSKATPVKMALWMNGFYLYEYSGGEDIKSSLVASMQKIGTKEMGLKEIFLRDKLKNSPNAKPIYE